MKVYVNEWIDGDIVLIDTVVEPRFLNLDKDYSDYEVAQLHVTAPDVHIYLKKKEAR